MIQTAHIPPVPRTHCQGSAPGASQRGSLSPAMERQGEQRGSLPFPDSGRQRLPRLLPVKLNSLGTCPGPGTSLPVPLNQRLAPCWPACSYTILEAKRIYSLKYKLFCPSGSQCPDNVTGHIFSIVVEVVMIFKRLWWTFLYGVTEQFSSIYKQIEVVT